MAIFRILKRLHTLSELKKTLQYIQGKRKLGDLDYSNSNYGLKFNGFVSNPCDTEALAQEIIFYHDIWGGSGSVIGCHAFFDFNGLLNHENAIIIGGYINRFWSTKHVAWLQGLHLYKGNYCYWPHLHLFICSRVLSGAEQGHLLHFGKELIAEYNQHANSILNMFGIQGIPSRKGGIIKWN